LLVLTLSACMSSNNQGHRLGADLFEKKYTENTLESIKAPLSEDFGKFWNFKYYELDIRETADAELILYHDRYFSKRLLADTDANKRILAISYRRL
jgi:glycerophosphoryl diester phosphodiesterase